MMKIKKGIKILIGCVCAISLIACQDTDSKIVYKEQKDTEKIEISFLTTGFDGDTLSIFDPVIKKFHEEKPHIKVAFENYNDKNKSIAEYIKNRIEGSEPLDIVSMDVVNIFEYARQNQIIDFSQTEMAKNLNDIARKDSLVDGKVMSIPTGLSAYCLGANMDMLNACHLDVPTNWEEFIHCCEVLKKKGYQPIVGTKNFPKMFVIAGGLSQIYFNGHEEENIQNLNSGDTKISVYAKRGFEMLAELVDKGYIDTEEALNHAPSESIELFAKEKGCFTIGNSVSYNVNELNFELSILPFPIDNGYVSLIASDRRLAVMNDSKHIDESLEFLEFLTNKGAQELSVSSFGRLPAYQTASKTVDKRMSLIMKSLDQNQVMLIQDYSLVFEQWGNLNTLINNFLKNQNIQEQLDAFDKIQADAIAKSQ